jgi:hypothetical protein
MKKRSPAIFAFVMLFGLVVGVATANSAGAKGVVWKDLKTGLTWQVSPTGGPMKWAAAKSHCARLKLGDSGGWRLPTIDELRSLIRGCPATQKGGYCGVTDACLSWKSCRSYACDGCSNKGGPGQGGAYWPKELAGEVNWYWSSSAVANSDYIAWLVYFYSGYVGYNLVSYDYHVRCVR